MISRRLLRIKILQILYAHFNAEGSNSAKTEKELTYSIQKGYDLYYYLLLLPVVIKRYAESRIDLAFNKKLPTYEDLHPNTRFVDNVIIKQIKDNNEFKKYNAEHYIKWTNHPELIKNLFLKLIDSLYYKEYMERTETNYATDKQLLIDFFSNELEEYDLFYEILEEQSIFWNDDIEFMVGMVIKTLKDVRPDRFDLLPIYKSSEDRNFAYSLLRATIANYDEYHKLIDGYVNNWDMERVANIDNLIMQMAINELVEFPSIPVKVTFDEYLELAKYYSTHKSSIFINGLLDKISNDLIENGTIVKTGRGLLTE